MAKLIPVTGTVTEVSNSLIQQHWTDYGTVHIREDNGNLTQIRSVIVTSDMPNAVDVGTKGTFYFREIQIWGGVRKLLAACVINGQLRTTSVRNGAFTYGVMTVMSIFLIPVVVGLIAFPVCLAATISHARAQRQISALRRNPPAGTDVPRVRTI